MNTIKLTKRHARKVLDVVDAGLCSGIGTPEPGKMCVEAAVCYALGMPHGDNPACVGEAVRAFKITLNDAVWPSNAARAAGLRKIAIAQLGSDLIDQREFATRVTIKTIQRILPVALRAAAGSVNQKHKDALETAAVACESAIDLADAAYAAHAAAAAAAAANAAANAAVANANADAAAAAYANAYAANAYADAANAAANARKKVLQKAADIGVEVLRELGCQGVKWIGLTEQTA